MYVTEKANTEIRQGESQTLLDKKNTKYLTNKLQQSNKKPTNTKPIFVESL